MYPNEFIETRIQTAVERVIRGETDSLDLMKLSLSSVPDKVFECESLKVLQLASDAVINEQNVYLSEEYWWEVAHDNNCITVLPEAVARLGDLEVLDISQNELHIINPAIGRLKNLRVLRLRNNFLGEIPEEIGRLQNLEVLDLSFNCLKKLPTSLSNLINLRELNLYANNLTCLPGELAQLSKLEYLNIGNFDIKRTDPETIERFDLRTNYFEVLPPGIAQLPELKEIHAENALSSKLCEILSWGLDAYPYVFDEDEDLQKLWQKQNRPLE
jgi:Leucine-rich repeat (LRR) protein